MTDEELEKLADEYNDCTDPECKKRCVYIPKAQCWLNGKIKKAFKDGFRRGEQEPQAELTNITQQLEEKTQALSNAQTEIEQLENELIGKDTAITDLGLQIDLMKCCHNCKHSHGEYISIDGGECDNSECKNHYDCWELDE